MLLTAYLMDFKLNILIKETRSVLITGILFCILTVRHACSTLNCDIVFDPWSTWSTCSISCGPGVQTRLKKCTEPDCLNPTSTCSDVSPMDLTDTHSCTVQIFEPPILGSWGYWSECTRPCRLGNTTGTRIRRRTCSLSACPNGETCEDKVKESQICNTEPCQDVTLKTWFKFADTTWDSDLNDLSHATMGRFILAVSSRLSNMTMKEAGMTSLLMNLVIKGFRDGG